MTKTVYLCDICQTETNNTEFILPSAEFIEFREDGDLFMQVSHNGGEKYPTAMKMNLCRDCKKYIADAVLNCRKLAYPDVVFLDSNGKRL